MPTAADVSELQIYPGYEPSDIEALQRAASQPVSIGSDHYCDGFGVKTLFECVPFVAPVNLNAGRLGMPVPDDGFHAEAIEYMSLADSLRRFGTGRFCAVELGAGWGPWIGLAGVLAKARNVSDIVLVGVEASTARFDLMRRHLAANGLRAADAAGEDGRLGNIMSRLFRGAVWTETGVVYFPDTATTDMGATATSTKEKTDNLGREIRMQVVPCRTMQKLLGDLAPIDFIHLDIQGSEIDVLAHEIAWASRNVRSMLVATHSRSIEGRLIDLMLAHKWVLHREKPCRVNWANNTPALVGRTTHDGTQYWLNPALAPAAVKA